MNADLSKLCVDFLRASFASRFNLKPTNAHELIAAFLGYTSQAAQKAEVQYPLADLDDAEILIPDIPLMDKRRLKLKGLPEDLPSSLHLAEMLAKFLKKEKLFSGEIWVYESLELYIAEQFLIDKHYIVEDELSGAIASTNAEFSTYPDYDEYSVEDKGDSVVVSVSGIMQGEMDPDSDRMYSGHEIKLGVEVTLVRIAGKRGFAGDPEISVSGAADKDWGDQDDDDINVDMEHEFDSQEEDFEIEPIFTLLYDQSFPDEARAAGLEFSRGSEVYALLDRKDSKILVGSAEPGPASLLAQLAVELPGASLKLKDYHYVKIENARRIF